jgi:ribonuclease E
MATKMLIEAAHPEETRVVVIKGQQLEEFDFEAASRTQLKGNIYLAKVTRVEPSLQAAFIEYGGNRHGFLAFNEIHPDYYQIPVADRQALLAAEAKQPAGAAAAAEAEVEAHAAADAETDEDGAADDPSGDESPSDESTQARAEESAQENSKADPEDATDAPKPDDMGGDEIDEQQLSRQRQAMMRSYKIQEVIKRHQILLVQVVKEERGNKGAALTTYISIAGRYCVLMPNTARGGGISRKITNAGDRKRLKGIVGDISIPKEMALIVRTAGAQRTKPEIKRDYDYLSRLWGEIRDTTLSSIAPTRVHEEANLIKRSIRDLYTKDVEEVLVEGDKAYKSAKKFMRMLMPSHAKRVQPYKESVPLFRRYNVDAQLDSMMSTRVTLKSGGYIIINSTEALVAIDVNSGRSTRERNIEETAVKTNIEAAQEVGRQLRLRDLAGLIVIDFIDMDENRNNRAVERKIKESLKSDRARIQIGQISHFGLMEMSRQRLRPSLLESSSDPCPTCGGSGIVYSIESAAMRALRALEDEALRGQFTEVSIFVPSSITLYLLNQKRSSITSIEERYGLTIHVRSDDTLIAPDFRVERGGDKRETVLQPNMPEPKEEEEEEEDEPQVDDGEAADSEKQADGDDEDQPLKRRRRGRRGGRKRRQDTDGNLSPREEDSNDGEDPVQEAGTKVSEEAPSDGDGDGDGEPERPRARRRRGGRGRRGRGERTETKAVENGEQSNANTRSENTRDQQSDIPEAGELSSRSSDADEEAPNAPSTTAESEPEPVPNAAAVVETEGPESRPSPVSEPEPNDKPTQPKKRGWWSRALS